MQQPQIMQRLDRQRLGSLHGEQKARLAAAWVDFPAQGQGGVSRRHRRMVGQAKRAGDPSLEFERTGKRRTHAHRKARAPFDDREGLIQDRDLACPGFARDDDHCRPAGYALRNQPCRQPLGGQGRCACAIRRACECHCNNKVPRRCACVTPLPGLVRSRIRDDSTFPRMRRSGEQFQCGRDRLVDAPCQGQRHDCPCQQYFWSEPAAADAERAACG